MKYVVLVSHGTFAHGLKSVLAMLAGGEREDVKSICLEDGMSADTFAQHVAKEFECMDDGDEIILLGDIIGGSPLTNAIQQISERGMIEKTCIFGGMNLPMALTATLMKDDVNLDMLKESMLSEGKNAMKEFVMEASSDEEDDI